ncbi:MAG: hypothetical protein WDO19_24055 [Bacteroidota bacterium]
MTNAQTPDKAFIPRILPNAPNTATLGRFGDYQVNQFTGVPMISIPLYTISANGIEIPVSISYHASGVKVSDFASFAGLGWALDAGGNIRRKMMGQPDEGASMFLTRPLIPIGSIDLSTENGHDYLNKVYTGMIDGEPDIYSYSFPSASGKFFFSADNDYNPVTIPYSPVKVNERWNSSDPYNLSFNILDERGNNYIFGESMRESTSSTHGGANTVGISAWMLEKIISSDKADTVSFTYVDQGALVADDYLDSWVVNDKITWTPGFPQVYSANSQASLTSTNSSAMVSEKSISEIKFRGGKLVFELAAANRQDFSMPGTINAKALNKIKVYNYKPATNQYQLLKTVVFFQSYFINGADALTKRLRLDSLHIDDNTGITVESYRFEYNTAIPLPVRYSRSRDYWGYYNGKANSLLIPRTDIDFWGGVNGSVSATTVTIGSNIANGREPDPAYTQAAVLKRIYYPTGGYTDFEYENNQYKDENNNARYGGGLRIKSIKSYESAAATPLVKTYKYGTLESGFGRANFFLRNYFLSSEQYYQHFVGTAVNEEMRVRTYFSNPTIEMEAYDGATVVYTSVTEYSGNETTNTGKIISQFRDRPDALASATYVRPTINSYFYARGQSLDKTTYKKLPSGAYLPVQAEAYTYTAFPETVYFGGFVVNRNVVPEVTIPPAARDIRTWSFNNYSINSDDNYPTSKTIIQYDPDDTGRFVKTTTKFTYGNITHQQPTKTTNITSRGDTIKTVNKYPADYITAGNTKTNNAVLDTMLAQNIQAAVIEKWDTLAKPEGGKTITGGQLNIFKRLGSGAIVRDNQKQLVIDAPITNFQPSSVSGSTLQNDSRYVTMINFDAYDAANNINQYTVKNAVSSSYIWDYSGKLPVAEIKNATIANTAYTSFEADGKGNWTFSGTPVADATAPTGGRAYSLTPGIPLSRSGLSSTTVYIVSYWTKNASAFTITGTQAGYPLTGKTVNGWKYFEHRVTGQTSITVSGTGYIDEVRLYPANAQMVTMTHEPLTGITSQCDASNRITYYEYDALGRLMLLRDQDKSIIKTMEYKYKR